MNIVWFFAGVGTTCLAYGLWEHIGPLILFAGIAVFALFWFIIAVEYSL